MATDTENLSHSDGGPRSGPSEEALRAQVLELQEEVVSRDELVQALTVQLEQLAEQLDRLQRSGADRKRSGGLPADIVDGQKKVITDLERVVQQWEDMQAGLTLGRIEVQLSELRDFVADCLSSGGAIPRHPGGGSSYPTLPTSMVMERISITASPAEPPAMGSSEQQPTESQHSELPSMWESLKTRMLEDTPTITAEDLAAAPAPGEEPPLPAAINLSAATPEEIETAVDERDAYIAFLLRKVRQLSPVPTAPDWVSLESVPEDLCRTLESHTKQLEELLRTAEIEMSIERARIGREQSRLRQQQEAIDKQMRRLGLKTLDDQAVEPEEVSVTDRRWVRFLGLPKGK